MLNLFRRNVPVYTEGDIHVPSTSHSKNDLFVAERNLFPIFTVLLLLKCSYKLFVPLYSLQLDITSSLGKLSRVIKREKFAVISKGDKPSKLTSNESLNKFFKRAEMHCSH